MVPVDMKHRKRQVKGPRSEFWETPPLVDQRKKGSKQTKNGMEGNWEENQNSAMLDRTRKEKVVRPMKCYREAGKDEVWKQIIDLNN